MSLARGVILTEIARLEKCIREKSEEQAKYIKEQSLAGVNIGQTKSVITEMSKRVGELKQEVDRMITIRQPSVLWASSPEEMDKRFISEIEHFRTRFMGRTISDKETRNAVFSLIETMNKSIKPAGEPKDDSDNKDGYAGTMQRDQQDKPSQHPLIRVLNESIKEQQNIFEKCVSDARNYQAHIDAHQKQKKEYEDMATAARETLSKLHSAVNSLK